MARNPKIDNRFIFAWAEQRLKLYKRRMFETGSPEDKQNYCRLAHNLKYYKHMVGKNSFYPLDELIREASV